MRKFSTLIESPGGYNRPILSYFAAIRRVLNMESSQFHHSGVGAKLTRPLSAGVLVAGHFPYTSYWGVLDN